MINWIQTPLGIAVGILLGTTVFAIFIRRLIIKKKMRAVEQHLGLYGLVVYADSGPESRAFISKKYGVLGKPDFIVKLATGEYVVVEYKHRASGRLYDSDVAQVKATVLAVRSRYKVTRAFVLAGSSRHEIDIQVKDAALYKEIKQEVEQVKRAMKGEVLPVYTDKTVRCGSCHNARNCSK